MKKYKLEFYPAINSTPFVCFCETLAEAEIAKDTIAAYDIFLGDNGHRLIAGNVGMIYAYNFKFEEWEEIEE